MALWLSDSELQDATRRRQPAAQARVLARLGVPFKRRPDGTLLVGTKAFESILLGGNVAPQRPANGLNWSKSAS